MSSSNTQILPFGHNIAKMVGNLGRRVAFGVGVMECVLLEHGVFV